MVKSVIAKLASLVDSSPTSTTELYIIGYNVKLLVSETVSDQKNNHPQHTLNAEVGRAAVKLFSVRLLE